MRTLLILLGIIVTLSCTANAKDDTALKTQKEKISYGIGMDIGNSLKEQSLDIDAEKLAQGIKDTLTGKEPLLGEKEFKDTMQALKQEMIARQMKKMQAMGEKNKKEGEAFLSENKDKEGVVTLPSGLQYKILKEGKGEKPEATDTVTVDYSGKLLDGTEFDSSYKRGEPATFPVNGVIAGWTEALQLMKPGAKWRLFIPSDLAYGERGAGQQIGPNATLVFDVELLSVEENSEQSN